MARDEQPTLSDISLGADVHLQTLWAELGANAEYYVHGTQGDCMVIHIKLTQDLMVGMPYHKDLRIDLAFVLDGRGERPSQKPSKKGSDDDTLVGMDPPPYQTDRPTLPEMPAVVVRSTMRPIPDFHGGDRQELWFASMQSVPGHSAHRVLLVRPTLQLVQMDERPWFLEIKMPGYDLIRRVRPALTPFFR